MNPRTAKPSILAAVALALAGCGSSCGGVSEGQETHHPGAESAEPHDPEPAAPASEVRECLLLGGAGEDQVSALAATPDGGLIAAGTFEGRIDLDPGPGEEPRGQPGARAAFVVSLGADGELRWARDFGGPRIGVTDLAITAEGEALVVGSFLDDIDLGPAAALRGHTGAGGWDLFLIKLSPGGDVVWARAISAPTWVGGQGVAVADDGSIRLAGTFEGAVDLDPGEGVAERTPDGLKGAFVVALDAGGTFQWASTLGSDWLGGVLRLAAGPAGTSVLMGSFQGSIDLDPGRETDAHQAAGSYDVFLLKLDAEGRAVWARAVGGPGLDVPGSLVVAPDGSLAAAGSFERTIDLDPGAGASEHRSEPGRTSFLVSLDSAGTFRWGLTSAFVGGLAVTPDGQVLAGTTAIAAGEERGALGLLRLDTSGERVAEVSLPVEPAGRGESELHTAINAVAAPSRDRVVVGGAVVGPIDGGEGGVRFRCRSTGGPDGFLLDLRFPHPSGL